MTKEFDVVNDGRMRWLSEELEYRDPTAPTIKYSNDPDNYPGSTVTAVIFKGKFHGEYRHEIPSTKSQTEDFDTGMALAAHDALPQLVRDLQQQSDIFIQLDSQNRIRKVIQQRNPECQQGANQAWDALLEDLAKRKGSSQKKMQSLVHELVDLKPSRLDALEQDDCEQLSAVAQEELGQFADDAEVDDEGHPVALDAEGTPEVPWAAPKEKFDLIYWADAPQPDGSKGFSAWLFPTIQWKGKLKGSKKINGKLYSCQKIAQRLWARIIFDATLMPEDKLNRLCWFLPSLKARRRAEELYKIEQFLRTKKKSQEALIEEGEEEEETLAPQQLQMVQS